MVNAIVLVAITVMYMMILMVVKIMKMAVMIMLLFRVVRTQIMDIALSVYNKWWLGAGTPPVLC